MKNQTQTLPINEILIEDRQRLDLGDLESLSQSLRLYGLIQPIVVDQGKRLIAGGRRLAAATKLGWTDINVVFRETLSEEEKYLLELEENVRRKEMSWQEHCLTIAKIHNLKCVTGAAEGVYWTQSATSELLGIPGTRQLSETLKISTFLRDELDQVPSLKRPYWACETVSDAIKLYLRGLEDKANALLAAQHQAQSVPIEVFEQEQTALAEFDKVEASSDGLDFERERYYENPLNPPNSFDSYWKEKQEWANQARQTIHLSSRLIKGDSIAYMLANPGRFDHIITDIPYGIDLDMISQSKNTFSNIDTVEELHDVEYNKQLIADFFPAAFTATKERAFVIIWCDEMLWQYMYDLAIKAGFAVQRWSVKWNKTVALNQCAAYNFTKDTEIAIVCRKPKTTLAKIMDTCTITAGKDEMCASLNHPFAKPFAVWKFLIEAVSLEGQSILEPFAGRGSGVLSMLELKRNVIGVELDEAHYNALLENVKKFYLKINPNFLFK